MAPVPERHSFAIGCCRIFLTHFHGDHCFGLGGILELVAASKAHLKDAAKRRLHVVGPPGLVELCRASLMITGLLERLDMPLLMTELVVDEADAHSAKPLIKDGCAMVERLAPERLPVDKALMQRLENVGG